MILEQREDVIFLESPYFSLNLSLFCKILLLPRTFAKEVKCSDCFYVSVSVCVSVCLLTFKAFDLEILFGTKVHLGTVKVSRSLGQDQGHSEKILILLFGHNFILLLLAWVINEVKVMNQVKVLQGQGHFKVNL